MMQSARASAAVRDNSRTEAGGTSGSVVTSQTAIFAAALRAAYPHGPRGSEDRPHALRDG